MTHSPATPAYISPASHNEDDRGLERRVRTFLVNRHVPALRHLQVAVHQGVATLNGRVSTFYEKQLAQASARRVAGIQHVLDEVRVVPGLRTNPHTRRTWTYHVSADADWTRPRSPR